MDELETRIIELVENAISDLENENNTLRNDLYDMETELCEEQETCDEFKIELHESQKLIYNLTEKQVDLEIEISSLKTEVQDLDDDNERLRALVRQLGGNPDVEE